MVVLDFTRLLPGPLATYILAHLGFEVIRVEDPRGSDIARYAPPYTEWGEGALFSLLNAGKKSIAVDLKTPEGLQVATDLIRNSDVLVEGFRPGTMRRFGLDFESVKEFNPRIIYCSISGYGQHGAMSQKAGHDINYISFSGVLRLFISGEDIRVPPIQIADVAGALFAVIGILFKLCERNERNSTSGCHIDISMAEASLFFAIEPLSRFLVSREEPEPSKDILSGGVICYNTYRTRDKRWLSIAALEPKFWENLTRALGLSLLPSDSMSPPNENNEAYRMLSEKISSMTSEEIDSVLGNSDIPYEFVRGFDEVTSDELLNSREIFYTVKEGKKEQTLLRLPFMKKVKTASPTLGQHTREILRRIGYSDQRIEELESRGVIVSSSP